MTRLKRSLRTDEARLADAFSANVIDFPATAPEGQARTELLTTIYERIIPELVLAHRPESLDAPAECADARPPPTPAEVEEFANIAVSQDLAAALACIQSMASDGISLEVIFLQLLTPAARLLGADWETDTRSFMEVTIGLSLIQKVVAVLGPSFAPGLSNRGYVVLVSPQAEQHTLGIYILGEFLRRGGWTVEVAPSMPERALVELVESERVEVVGLSVSNTELLGQLGRLIRNVKRASLNSRLTVMLGGTSALAEHATALGATYCQDAPDAVRFLERRASAKEDLPGS